MDAPRKTHSMETRRKMSETHKRLNSGKRLPRLIGELNPNYGNSPKHTLTDEWKEKNRQRMLRENNPRWISDRSLLKTGREKMYDTQYKYWMREVKNRDGWKCKIANDDCSGRLEAHHILGWRDYPELRYQLNNGITLCHAHHPRKRVDEAKLTTYFQKLVGEMN